MKKIYSIIIFFISLSAKSQVITPEQYIAMYKDFAIKEMKRMGIPASITLAQGLLETESGNSDLVKKSNNHFGIKCKSTWLANGVSHDDDAPGECFRVYKTAEDSYRDHSNFLRGSERYAFLFKLSPLDYKGWAYGLKKAGYATNVKYPEILIRNIEQYNLQQYSMDGMKDMPEYQTDKFQNDPEITVSAADTTAFAEPIENTTPTGSTLDVSDAVKVMNGVKYIIGKKGASLLVIASRNNISLARLLEFNELGEDGLLVKDQYIFLQKKSKTGATDFYVVKQGETVYDVAQKNAIQIPYLLAYNKLTDDAVVKPGTKLALKPGVSLTPEKNSKEIQNTVKYYEVQPKEGLYSISKKFGVNMQQLREWNNLTSDSLKIGQQLIISK